MSREAALAIATGAPLTEAPKLEGSQPPGQETPATSETPPKDDLVSSRIAQIAKKEAKYQQEMEGYKKKMAEFQESKAKFDPFYERYKQFEEMKGKDPVAAIKMLGFSDTDYVNFVAAQEDKSTPEERATKIAQAEIHKFKAEQAELSAKETQRRNEETEAQYKKNVGITIKTNADKFKLCSHLGEEAEEFVFKMMTDVFHEEQKTNPEAQPMTAEQAAEYVEGFYKQQVKEMHAIIEAEANAAEGVVQEEVVAKKEEPLKAEVVTPPKPPLKTLTNRASPTLAATAAASKKVESRTEKRERLIAALRAGAKP